MQAEAGRQRKEGTKEGRIAKRSNQNRIENIYLYRASSASSCVSTFSSNSIAKPERERESKRERDGGEGYDGDKTKPREAMAIAKRKKRLSGKLSWSKPSQAALS